MRGVVPFSLRGFLNAPQTKKENKMYDDKRIGNLQKHIAEHPHDYQAIIGLLKARSDAIDHQIHEAKVEKLKKVAEVRRKYYEESEQ